MNSKKARKPPSRNASGPEAERRASRTRRRASAPVSSTIARNTEALSGK